MGTGVTVVELGALDAPWLGPVVGASWVVVDGMTEDADAEARTLLLLLVAVSLAAAPDEAGAWAAEDEDGTVLDMDVGDTMAENIEAALAL